MTANTQATQNTVNTMTNIAVNDKITLDDITIDQAIQMREELHIPTVQDYAEAIEELPPVTVVAVITAYGEKWYLVDGFHRYAAHKEAGRKEIAVNVVEGTFDQAFDMAMTTNYKNGRRPTTGDQRKSVTKLVEHYRDSFGLDSKKVVPFLVAKGIGKRTAERYTGRYTVGEEKIDGIRIQIDKERDETIYSLSADGLNPTQIAEETGIKRSTINNILSKCPNTPVAEKVTVSDAECSAEGEASVDSMTPMEEALDQAESNVVPFKKAESKRRTDTKQTEAMELMIKLAQAVGEVSVDDFRIALDGTDHGQAQFDGLMTFMQEVKVKAQPSQQNCVDNDHNHQDIKSSIAS